MDLEAFWAEGRLAEGLAWCLERLEGREDGLHARYALEFALDLGDRAALKRLLRLPLEDPGFLALKAIFLVQQGEEQMALELAQRAYQAEPQFLTAFALGHAVLLRSTREAEGWLLEALRHAERQGSPHRQAQVAAALGLLQLNLGQYRRALVWAEWGLSLAEGTTLAHPMLRNLLQVTHGYAQALTGRLEAPPELYPLPGVEVFRGDFWLAAGDPGAALRAYEGLQPSSRAYEVILLARKVRAWLALGRVEEASLVGQRALALGEGLPSLFREWAELAYLMPLALWRPSEAVAGLADLLSRLRQRPSFLRAAMAILYLARAYWGLGWREKTQSLVRTSPELEGLSPSGLAFLAGPKEAFAPVFQLLQPLPSLRLHLLGRPSVWLGSQRLGLGFRQLEVLTALAASPQGLNAQELALWVWGERGSPEVARAELNRLRKKVPLEGGPYRLPPGYWADFLEVRTRLLRRDLEGALALYGGPLLPGSEAPGVVGLREELWQMLKSVTLSSGSADLMVELALQEEDPEFWELARERLDPGDPRRALLEAKIKHYLST
ncbi:hypothetical protein [Thermus tengchongensis]|uniref:Transcriptional regulator n=1 Tax=Thermus tengchongensis TaxID=1214928 RepID=A0A4Y9FAK1_9DEIN|nr:hypothetical protein [Thermus tengchongensis]TFU25198.1 hypothetical protein E0687_12065 [Thermus tengchongensis]